MVENKQTQEKPPQPDAQTEERKESLDPKGLFESMTEYAAQAKYLESIPDERMRRMAVQVALQALLTPRKDLWDILDQLDKEAETADHGSAAWYDHLDNKGLVEEHKRQRQELNRRNFSEAQRSRVLTKSDRKRQARRRSLMVLEQYMPPGPSGLIEFKDPQYRAAQALAVDLVDSHFLNLPLWEQSETHAGHFVEGDSIPPTAARRRSRK